jgi:hypothetical protein
LEVEIAQKPKVLSSEECDDLTQFFFNDSEVLQFKNKKNSMIPLS